MNYAVTSVYNNNAVLAKDLDNNQVLILGKGIGFGKKQGDIVSDNAGDNKVYYIFEDNTTDEKLKKLSSELEALPKIIKNIIYKAEDSFKYDSEKLCESLLDHISFAVQRLNMGFTIENPFITEISLICPAEYKLAKKLSKDINEVLGINIGKSEEGFVALHIYSASNHKSVKTAMKKTRIVNKVFQMVDKALTLSSDMSLRKDFIVSLGKIFDNPQRRLNFSESFIKSVKNEFPEIYSEVLEIAKTIKEDFQTVICEEMLVMLTLELVKVRVLSDN